MATPHNSESSHRHLDSSHRGEHDEKEILEWYRLNSHCLNKVAQGNSRSYVVLVYEWGYSDEARWGISYTKLPQAPTAAFERRKPLVDENEMKLARAVHGQLVADVKLRGTFFDPAFSKHPFTIYKTEYPSGFKRYSEVAPRHSNQNSAEKDRLGRFIDGLEKYFGNCLVHRKEVDDIALDSYRDSARYKLHVLQENISMYPHLRDILPEIQRNLRELFSSSWPQVVTHGNLTQHTILVNETSNMIDGILDWPVVSPAPFGMELSILRASLGTMTPKGWQDYDCRNELETKFWDSVWRWARIEDPAEKQHFKTMARFAEQLGAILQFAFERDAAGFITDTLVTEPSSYLLAWSEADSKSS
ncbi:hypothetical protein GGR57DRAFT_517440 [Xylariaceae sp. FL1272]|nr:hypothetical protein GGR57DRAFT_517440 [Xylariaceae sp. FL1272]